MKHKWRNLRMNRNFILCECILCGCRRLTAYNDLPKSRIPDVSYMEEGQTEYHRSRPECKDKVNLELQFVNEQGK